MSGRLLMPDIDDPDPLLDAAVEDGNDVPTRESEDRVDALVLQGPGDNLTTMDLSHQLLEDDVQTQVNTRVETLNLSGCQKSARGE